MFEFEGSRPHLSPNTASGKTLAGAVKSGHFYVAVDKIGSLLLDAGLAPFSSDRFRSCFSCEGAFPFCSSATVFANSLVVAVV